MFQSFVFKCPDVQSTETLAIKMAQSAVVSDVFLLEGTLGVGKSVFARAFIQSLTAADEIPSPTFTLVQTYAAPDFDIYHFDLYRIKSPEEIWELNVEEAFSGGVCLVEWPSMMGPYVPSNAIKINIKAEPEGSRVFEINFPTEALASRFSKTLFSNKEKENIHATTVDIDGNGILIVGASGQGKSDLALRLIENKNAVLVSDDRTDLKNEGGKLIACPPKAIEGLLEIRGLGIIKMPFKPQTQIKLVVCASDKQEIERYPKDASYKAQDILVPCVLLDLLEPSALDKIVVKLNCILEDEKQKS